MEKMEKVCPSCGKKCPPVAGFCTGCGTNIQAVAPTPTQAAVAMDQASAIAGQAFASVKSATKGTPIMNFIPAVIAFCSLMCVLVGHWVTSAIDYNLSFFNLVELYGELDVEFLGVLTMIFVAIPLMFIIPGAILAALKKTVGKVLAILGNSFMIPVMIAYFIVMAVAADESRGLVSIGASPIFLFIFSIAGIVFAALAKTGKKAEAQAQQAFNPYQQAYAPQAQAYNPNQAYAPQQQAYNPAPQYDPNQNYNNPNQF